MKSHAGQLLKQLGECFAAYKECIEQDPRLQEQALAFDEMNQKIFNRMRMKWSGPTMHRDAGLKKQMARPAARHGYEARSIAICT